MNLKEDRQRIQRLVQKVDVNDPEFNSIVNNRTERKMDRLKQSINAMDRREAATDKAIDRFGDSIKTDCDCLFLRFMYFPTRGTRPYILYKDHHCPMSKMIKKFENVCMASRVQYHNIPFKPVELHEEDIIKKYAAVDKEDGHIICYYLYKFNGFSKYKNIPEWVLPELLNNLINTLGPEGIKIYKEYWKPIVGEIGPSNTDIHTNWDFMDKNQTLGRIATYKDRANSYTLSESKLKNLIKKIVIETLNKRKGE